MRRCIEVALTIPDNEARTALATLQRLGIGLSDVTRGDLYRCDVDDAYVDELPHMLRSFETVFNPNKHALRVREGEAPLAGEVWIDENGHTVATAGEPVRLAGRMLAHVRSVERFTAWHLSSAPNVPAPASVVDAALEALLCNPAFQKAIR